MGLSVASWGSLFGCKGADDSATLAYMGARLGFGALLVEEVGWVAGVWASAQLDLMTKEFELESPSTFINGPIQKNIRVGGHLLAAGLSLCADF